MATSAPRSTTSEPDALFPAQDDGLASPFVHAYQQRHYSYPMISAHANSVPFSIASTIPLGMFSQPHTFEFLTTAPATQTTYWPSPPLSVGPEQCGYDAISSSTHSPAQTVPVALQYEPLVLGQEQQPPMPSFTSAPFVPPSSSDISRDSNPSRASSPGNTDLKTYGYQNHPSGTWSCAYPGCTSKAVFTRGCDLRKHHKRHTKSFFCRYPNCTQSSGGGFSSKKDLARHEAKHNPTVVCEWHGCERVFSRVDNMVRNIFTRRSSI